MVDVAEFPNVETWARTYLRAKLTGRPESYAAATVDISVPSTIPARFVQVRADGGSDLNPVQAVARLGVNVWAPTEAEASDLARLVRAIFKAAAGTSPVDHVTTTGPSPIPDAKPRRFFTVELTIRGSVLSV